VALEAALPEQETEYAARGTLMHAAAALYLAGEHWIDGLSDEEATIVEKYVDQVCLIAGTWPRYIEQRVDFSGTLNVPEGYGTADCVILTDDEIILCDLKTGRGVQVDAERNEQLMLYALGALEMFGMAGDFKRVRLLIIQPPLDHVSEWSCDLAELDAFATEVIPIAQAINTGETRLEPGEKQCRFCKVKADCPALAQHVSDTVVGMFDDLDAATQAVASSNGVVIGEKLSQVDLVEQWCKAVRERAYDLLASGVAVDGFKLVEGKRGARAWADKEQAEAALKAMRLKVEDMYDLSLISPTTAEKRAKAGIIGPKQWPKLQPLITQSPGRPSVAPATDKRPAITLATQPTEFENLEELT
jgi:hypothetical protein